MFGHGWLILGPRTTRNKSYDPIATIVNSYGIKIDVPGISPERDTPNIGAMVVQDLKRETPLSELPSK
jgi:hypothetical protein